MVVSSLYLFKMNAALNSRNEQKGEHDDVDDDIRYEYRHHEYNEKEGRQR